MVLIELVDGKWIKEKLDREQTSPQKSSIIDHLSHPATLTLQLE